MSEKIEIRDEVKNFAEAMEKILKQNDYKGGWSEDKCSLIYLFDKFKEELKEFEECYTIADISNRDDIWTNYQIILSNNKSIQDLRSEILDMANVLMMIYDRTG